MKEVKLFCIPYSGGSASAYLIWRKEMPDFIKICPVELMGHGSRINEALYQSVDEAVEDVANTIRSQLKPGDWYAILGHSMGAVLAFEAYYRLEEMGIWEPCHMFFSGRKSPLNSKVTTDFYKKSNEEFLDVVYKYGGTTKEIMANKELRDLFLPILRTDFMIAETYTCLHKREKIHCNITVTNGREDRSIAAVDMNEWKDVTDKDCTISLLPGDHFFLLQNGKMMIDLISRVFIQDSNFS